MRGKKYIWVPVLLSVYALAMALLNLDGLKSPHGARNFWLTIGVEALLIVGVTFFLKKSHDMKLRREELEKKIREQKEAAGKQPEER